MINTLIFSNDYEYAVGLYDNSGILLGSGTLKFGDGKLIQIHMDRVASFLIPEKENTLNATTASGDIFTLVNCALESNTVYADLIVCGKIESGVNSIKVRYADISEWFMHDQKIECKPGESILWGSPPPPVEAEVLIGSDSFSIKSEIYSSVTHKTEERIINEYVNFIFSKPDQSFDFSEIREKPHHLSCLLSILIAYPISISSIWVTGKNSGWLQAYFPAFERPKKEFEENQLWRNSLIRRKTLDTRWAELFNSYFNSPYLNTIWVRLAGMQRYTGFWEYRVLGYVTLLDSYADAISVRDNLKPIKERKSERDEVGRKIAQLNPALTPEQLQKIERILEHSLPDKKTEPNFKERYEHLINGTDSDITKIIDITPAEFKILKGARDAIAHNDAANLDKYPYENIYPITQKVTLLLTFKALSEFGIPAEDFIRSLGNTSNKLRYSEGLNTIHLERRLSPESFFKVSRELFEKISQFGSERIHPFFTLNSTGELHYSEEHVSLYNEWVRDRSRRHKCFADKLGVNEESINIISQMHVEFEDRIATLIGAHIISI